MLIVYLERLNEFSKTHADAGKSLATWKKATEDALWKNKQDVLKIFQKRR